MTAKQLITKKCLRRLKISEFAFKIVMQFCIKGPVDLFTEHACYFYKYIFHGHGNISESSSGTFSGAWKILQFFAC